ncbi:protein TPX2 isoform X2 [Ananas comosus]|uniref:Protein TPX2 isoform X2 n=1 Tax=Ananas comosus TaxID=4615 RepID=A0A6P5F973_ANACO|nr:protein TPX2 isoform X2 [Ananas comosus]
MALDSKVGGGGGGGGHVETLQIDEIYEFSAPRFFDFINEETEEEIRRAEFWFETSLSYAPSPFMPRIKEGRSVKIDTICDFGEADSTRKESGPEKTCDEKDNQMIVEENTASVDKAVEINKGKQQEAQHRKSSFDFVKPCENGTHPRQETSSLVDSINSSAPNANESKEEVPSFEFPVQPSLNENTIPDNVALTPKTQKASTKRVAPPSVKNQVAESCTPKTQRNPANGPNLTAKKIASMFKQPSALKPKVKSPPAQSCKTAKAKSGIKSYINGKITMATDVTHENQAIKRQKLDCGKARQILDVKNRVLPHKLRPGLIGSKNMLSSVSKGHKEFKEVTPFISAAEMVKKFESRTRELDLSQNRSLSHEDSASVIQRRPRLILTRPKEPELQTAHRVRAVRVKSSEELEQEMLAKIPKFKARPFNKKILEAPSLPALPRSNPQPPEFQEFHLRTMERAIRHAETSSAVSSLDASSQNHSKPLKLTEPRPPQLQTELRARPPKVKSSQELELEELEKAPKFKARPLNKKILESKGDIGLFSHPKPQITTPQEFHFATDDRLGQPASVVELFDKLSLHSETSSIHGKGEVPRITIPNPFHLHTEERGHDKERKFTIQIFQKELEEEKARIPRANPYPYTTDYPVVPPKPEPKPCTKPEAFQLESLVRHEEEMQRMLEEKERMEREEAQRRIFRAQPIMTEDPLPVPEKERKPLTEVQEIVLHVDQRSMQRSEFDKKIKEKEIVYKRLREEQESAKVIEEEKALKQMRRTMVPHARPLPKFDNPFCPQKSMKEVTKPKSPELRVDRRRGRRHALHMR